MLEIRGAGLRPLDTAAILDAAIEHVRDDARLFYGIALPVAAPLAVTALWFHDLCTDYRGRAGEYELRVQAGAIALAVLLHLRAVAQGAVTQALAAKLEGLEASPLAAWRAALRKTAGLAFAGAAFWWAALVGLLAAGAPLLLTVPILALQVPVQVFEERPPLSAAWRSAVLGRLEFGRAWSITLLLALAFLVIAAGIGLTAHGALHLARLALAIDTAWLGKLMALDQPAFLLAVSTVALAVLEPVKGVAFALLYVDRRVRTEGFDLRRKVALLVEAAAAEKRAREAAEALL